MMSLIPSSIIVLSLCKGLNRYARGVIWGVLAVLIQLSLVAVSSS